MEDPKLTTPARMPRTGIAPTRVHTTVTAVQIRYSLDTVFPRSARSSLPMEWSRLPVVWHTVFTTRKVSMLETMSSRGWRMEEFSPSVPLSALTTTLMPANTSAPR